MIYEERLTLTHAKSADAYLEHVKSNLHPQLNKEGGEPLCLLSGLIGDPANQYLQMTAFEDVQEWEAAQSKIPPPPSDLIESETVRLLRPIASRPKPQIPEEDRRAVYGCRRFQIDPANLADFVDSSQNGIWPRIESPRRLHPWPLDHHRHHPAHGHPPPNRLPQPHPLGRDQSYQQPTG